MITLKYEKKMPAVYISHIDLLRGMVRIIRRTGFTPEFSKGFNPHMLLFFSAPLAVGVSSVCEYVTVDIADVSPEDFMQAFNKSAPAGIVAVQAFYTEKAVNVQGRTTEAEYFFPSKNGVCTAEIAEFFKNKPEYTIEYVQKKVAVTKEVSSLIKDVRVVDGGIVFRLATGNENLRADRLLPALKKDFNLDTEVTDIIKIRQYVSTDKGIFETDKAISEALI